MKYTVKPGDTLWRLAGAHFADPEKWRALADDNNLRVPYQLWVGQQIQVRDSLRPKSTQATSDSLRQAVSKAQQQSSPQHALSMIPGRGFFFALADEVNPLRSKVVRKVMTSAKMAGELSQQLGKPIRTVPNPEKFGFYPTDPLSKLSIGRHALGMKPSPYNSASSQPFGSSRIKGSPFWIDVDKAKQAGATFHETDEILADLNRIAQKAANSKTLEKIAAVRKLVTADSEVVAKGGIPAAAIKGAGSMALTRGMQGFQIVGFVMTAADIYSAGKKSIAQNSVKPIAAESVRQGGSWAAAWAGAKLGAAGSAALGIETGPLDLLVGFAGGVAGGVAGYYGFDWIADHIDKN